MCGCGQDSMAVQWRCFGRVQYPLSTVTSSNPITKNGYTQLERTVTSVAADAHKAGIPLVPKDRDPNAVLKALATTVDPPRKPFFMGRSNSDPFAPRNRRYMIDLVMAREAGKTAGEYIVNRYPKLFPGRHPEPDLRPYRPSWQGLNEETLRDFIKAKKLSKAQEIYKELLEKGEKVSLETQNRLLALLANLGTDGNEDTADRPVSLEMIEETRNERDDGKLDDSLADRKPRRKLPRLNIRWGMDNDAEKMFAEMTEKDGITYSAIIQGLAKYEKFDRALKLFEEARKNGHQVTSTTYNKLLSAMLETKVDKQWKRAKDIVSHMSSSPIVQPDTTTMNLLLLFAFGTQSEARENALETMREMTHLGLKPNLTTFLRLLDCYMSKRDNSILYPIIEYIEKHSTEVLNITEYSDVDFFAYAMLGARNLRDASLAKRINDLAKTDCYYLVGTLETFLSHYLFVSAFEMDMTKVYNEYQTLVPHLFVPKEWLYLMLFKKCESESRPDIALTLWKDMMKNRVYIVNLDAINRLMGAFTKRLNYEDIEEYVLAVKDVWRKLIYLGEKPSSLIISVTIKILTLNNQLEDAWKCFDLFDKFYMKPSFLALHALLKVHYNFYDTERVMKVLDIMIDNELFLPLTYIKDICHNVKIPIEKKEYFLSEFQKNRPASSQYE